MDDLKIIEADASWFDKFLVFSQRQYQEAYTNEEIGITSDLHSMEIFNTPHFKGYFQGLLDRVYCDHIWFALDGRDEIIASVALSEYSDHFEMKAFYVDKSWQGLGLGRRMYNKVLEYAVGKPIHVEVISYAHSAISLYKHWGFQIDEQTGPIKYERLDWPEVAQDALSAILMIKPA